ncbi:MAG: hypothetical protein ACREJ5_12225 [Geminicoccaceae bacterium]
MTDHERFVTALSDALEQLQRDMPHLDRVDVAIWLMSWSARIASELVGETDTTTLLCRLATRHLDAAADETDATRH